MQGEAFLISQVGMTYFRCCDGRLLSLTVKNTQTFVVTVVQEPLALHVGTFRFHSLYHNSTRAHAFTVIQKFIETFDEYHVQPATSGGAGQSTAKHTSAHSVTISVKYPPGPLDGAQQPAEPTSASSPLASSGNLLNLARSSSLIMHEVSKIESMNRQAQRRRSSVHPSLPLHSESSSATLLATMHTGVSDDSDPTTMDAAGIGLRETVYLATEVAVDVSFSVFDTVHHISLDLRPVPGSPAIVRELFVWNYLMDAFRANARLQEQVRRLQMEQHIAAGGHVESGSLGPPTTAPVTAADIKIRLPSEMDERAAPTPSSSNRFGASTSTSSVSAIPSAFEKKPERRDPRHHPQRKKPVNALDLKIVPAAAGNKNGDHSPIPATSGTLAEGSTAAHAKTVIARPPSATSRSSGSAYMRTGRPASAGSSNTGPKQRPFIGDLRSKADALAAVLQAHECRTGSKADAKGLILSMTASSSGEREPHEHGMAATASPRPSSGRAAALGHVVVVSLQQGRDSAIDDGGPPLINLSRPAKKLGS